MHFYIILLSNYLCLYNYNAYSKKIIGVWLIIIFKFGLVICTFNWVTNSIHICYNYNVIGVMSPFFCHLSKYLSFIYIFIHLFIFVGLSPFLSCIDQIFFNISLNFLSTLPFCIYFLVAPGIIYVLLTYQN